MTKKSYTCTSCHRTVAGPKVKTMTIDSPKPGRTVLGRQVPLSAKVGYWQCPKCGKANAESFSLMLDPDAPLVRAFEKHFGTPDTSAIHALAKLNNDFIREFGEDWQDQFGGDEKVEVLIRMTVQSFKNQCSENWAAAMAQSDLEFVRHGDDIES